MNTKDEEIILMDIQMVASLVFIITIMVSIYLNSNEKHKLKYGEGFISDEASLSILKTNRIVIVALFFIYFYTSYKSRELDRINNKDLDADNLELIVSLSSIIGGLLILYAVYKYGQDSLAVFENPTN